MYYFAANGITDGSKKCAILISCCGPATFRLMKSLVFPDQLSDFSFAQLVEKVKLHREPKASIIVRRFQFNSRSRARDESIADYVAALRRLAEHCAFGNMLDEMLRDRVVCGINNSAIQKRLLAEPELTLTKAVAVAQATEIADTGVKELQSGTARASSVFTKEDRSIHKFTDTPTAKFTDNASKVKECYRCGAKHNPDQCRFKSEKCHACGKQGHIARVCRSKKKVQTNPNSGGRRPQTKQAGRTQYVGCNPNPEQEENTDDLPIYRVSKPSSHPSTVELEINHKKLLM